MIEKLEFYYSAVSYQAPTRAYHTAFKSFYFEKLEKVGAFL